MLVYGTLINRVMEVEDCDAKYTQELFCNISIFGMFLLMFANDECC